MGTLASNVSITDGNINFIGTVRTETVSMWDQSRRQADEVIADERSRAIAYAYQNSYYAPLGNQ